MSNITEEQADELGRLVDKLSNALAAGVLKLPPRLHIEGLSGTMESVRDELKSWIVAQGHDFWDTFND